MDFQQDIARSSYADMLNDDERNLAYYIAIKANISHMVKSELLNPTGQKVYKCCDIGTGSGLLSMMIVKTFRDLNYRHFSVTAFEAFEPMAECAKKIIEANGMSNDIEVISGRSEDYQGNPQFDLLVAELLDTELIGEGCLLTYRHAVKNLCSPNCIFIPKEAIVYIQLLDSQYLLHRHRVHDISACLVTSTHSESINIKVSDAVRYCCGLTDIDDMQLGGLEGRVFRQLAKAKEVFRFKFGDIHSLKLQNQREVKFPAAIAHDSSVVVAMWWDIIMYDESLFNEYISSTLQPYSFATLSCSPKWYRQDQYGERDQFICSKYDRGVWREHWIQGIYYLADPPAISEGQHLDITIYAHHDSHSLWFNTKPCNSKLPNNCTCGVHRRMSRSDLAFLNCNSLMSKLITALFHGKSGDRLPRRGEIVFMQREAPIEDGTNFDHHPKAKWQIKFWNCVNCLLPEILVDRSLQDEVSWSNLLKCQLNDLTILPFVSLEIKCASVYFTDLYRIRNYINHCEGFNVTHLNEMINQSSQLIDSTTESHHLHEYESSAPDGGALESFLILSTENCQTMEKDKIVSGKFVKRIEVRKEFLKPGWALVFWADFKLANGDIISSGPLQEGQKITWNMYFKQLVYFMPIHTSNSTTGEKNMVEFDIRLNLDGVTVDKRLG